MFPTDVFVGVVDNDWNGSAEPVAGAAVGNLPPACSHFKASASRRITTDPPRCLILSDSRRLSSYTLDKRLSILSANSRISA